MDFWEAENQEMNMQEADERDPAVALPPELFERIAVFSCTGGTSVVCRKFTLERCL